MYFEWFFSAEKKEIGYEDRKYVKEWSY